MTRTRPEHGPISFRPEHALNVDLNNTRTRQVSFRPHNEMSHFFHWVQTIAQVHKSVSKLITIILGPKG
jgi:hypothetical protein